MRWLGPLAVLVSTIAVSCSAPSSLMAQSADSEARVRFEAGRMAFSAERYEDALVDFERAYELSHRPILLFNIAQSYARLGRDREALDTYRRFLDEAPEGEAGREEAEAQVIALEDAIARAPVEPVDAAIAEPAPERTPSGDPTAGWILVGVGGALTIAGAVLSGLGLSDRASVESPAPGAQWSDIMAAYDRGPVLEGVGFSTLAVGLVGLAVGVVLVLTSSGDGAPVDRAARALRWSL